METLLQAEPPITMSDSAIMSIIKEIYAPDFSIRVRKDGPPIEQDGSQAEALRLSLRSQFCIVSGGPGDRQDFPDG